MSIVLFLILCAYSKEELISRIHSVDSESARFAFKILPTRWICFNLMMILGPDWPVIILMCMWNNPIGWNEECNVYVSDTEVTAWIMGI